MKNLLIAAMAALVSLCVSPAMADPNDRILCTMQGTVRSSSTTYMLAPYASGQWQELWVERDKKMLVHEANARPVWGVQIFKDKSIRFTYAPDPNYIIALGNREYKDSDGDPTRNAIMKKGNSIISQGTCTMFDIRDYPQQQTPSPRRPSGTTGGKPVQELDI